MARIAGFALLFLALPALAAQPAAAANEVVWWVWPVALFFTCFVMGIVAVPSGVGGGVLFVPIVGGFFPFHLDFVRGAGLLVAMSSALSACPLLLKNGLANLRVGLPLTFLVSASSIIGAMMGLAIPANIVQIALGVAILGIVALMASARKSEFPEVPRQDALSVLLGMSGVYRDAATGKDVHWQTHRTPMALLLFAGNGFLAGMFGMGAGWANVPVLNLLMGTPIKVAAGTSGLILTNSSAAWVYLNQGAILAMIAVPSVIGMMLGAMIGARLLHVLKASVIRNLVISILLFAGVRSLLKGFGIWV